MFAGRKKMMRRAANDHRQQLDDEQLVEAALIFQASDATSAIRKRLAAVADELRCAAAEAGASSENLIQLANKFEQHARSGEMQ